MGSGSVDAVKTLRVLLLHPGIAEPYDLTVVCDVDGSSLTPLQALVGGLIECVSLTKDHDMWIHEEGRLLGLCPNRAGLVGPIVVTRNDDEGNTRSLDEIDVQRLRPLLRRL